MSDQEPGKTIQELEIELQRRVDQEQQSKLNTDPATAEKEKAQRKKNDMNLALMALDQNETGDGILFVEKNHGRFAWDSQEGIWRLYNGVFWEYDEHYLHKAAVEVTVVPLYLALLEETNKAIIEATKAANGNNGTDNLIIRQKALIRRINRLRSESGKRNVLEAAKSNPKNLTVIGEQFDKKPYLLACKNAVIDLKLGEQIPAEPEQSISLACNAEWRGIEEPAPIWEEFLLDIMAGSEEMVDYLRVLIGYVACGYPKEHICSILWGNGRNGKSVFVEVIRFILNSYAGPIPAEMLLAASMSRSASGPSPDIMLLKGKRAVFASEPDEGRKFAVGPIKWMTGGDQLTGRWPHSPRFTTFDPTHTLFMLTNHKPKAPAEDYAFWQRLHLVPFPVTFVNRAPNNNLEKMMKKGLAEELKSKETSGILAWIVRGAAEYLANGLSSPKTITDATDAYRKSEDLLAEFYEDHCVIGAELEVPAKDIYLRFSDWYEENVGNKVPSAKWFGIQVGSHYERFKRNGVRRYKGIGLLSKQCQDS